jgi:hypothetical protein
MSANKGILFTPAGTNPTESFQYFDTDAGLLYGIQFNATLSLWFPACLTTGTNFGSGYASEADAETAIGDLVAQLGTVVTVT